ncbi:gliding motility-associated C-terminal domain-containing protein [Flavobacteriaceae bacterium MAR_2010_188]|nr:gliding motility-associated C-terminal domain-containing protein [Flavobacteriaceae bacterium MAR_2010_188]
MRNFTPILSMFMVLISSSALAQLVIGKPNLEFTQACASSSFNNYNLSFIFSPADGLSSSNQFILELSDESGSFQNATVLYTSSAGTVMTSPASVNFSFPSTISGEGYKIRVKSTFPVATSTGSNVFSAYYKAQDSPFTINNLVGSAAFCLGGSYELTIDNPGTGSNDSPLNYPELTFNWYKQTSETTSVFVEEGNSLTVSEPGTYYCETNYGSCTSNSFSNRVTVVEASGNTESSISSSFGNPFCPDAGPTTLTTISADSYQWFKDGVAIPDSNVQSIETDESGEYSVNIDLGSCDTSAKIVLESEQFASDISAAEVNYLAEGETMMVVITTNADSPIYKWFYNESLIEGASTNSYEVSEAGNYKVTINQTTGCEASKEYQFRIASAADVAEIPNLISPNGDGFNDSWMIPQEYLSGSDTSITIISSQGRIVFQTKEYANDWPREQLDFNQINPVYYYVISPKEGKERKGSITVIK